MSLVREETNRKSFSLDGEYNKFKKCATKYHENKLNHFCIQEILNNETIMKI